MAGLVLTLGKIKHETFTKIKTSFNELKQLPESHEQSIENFHLVKYKKKYDNEDNNYYESKHVIVCAVGSLLYQGFGFSNSIMEIGKSLDQGNNIRNMMDDIDGTFCLTVLNKKKNTCFIVTDIGGVINTYLRKVGNAFFISTSMLALAKAYPVSLDRQSILMFLRSGMFFDETTYFNEITVLKPATIYQYDLKSNKFINEKYWSVPREVNEKISFKEAASKITTSLKHIIDHIPDDEAIYDFTGGYDSRFVLALAYGNEENRRHLNGFFFGPPNSREAKIIEKSCTNLRLNYNNYILPKDWNKKFVDYIFESNNLCDGMINACEYAPVLWVQKKKKEKFNYAVLGLFGEIYRGFTAKQEFLLAGRNRPANIERYINYRNLAGSFDLKIFSPVASEVIKRIGKNLLEIYSQTNNKLFNFSPNTLQLDNIYFSHRMRRWGGRSVTSSNQFIRQICPLWFRTPLTIAFSLPFNMKAHEKLMRYITEEISPALARERTISGSPFLPINGRNLILFFPAIIFYLIKAYRKFVEVTLKRNVMLGITQPDYKAGEWFRQTLKDPRCQDLLNYEKMLSKSFYDERGFNEFIQRAKTSEFHFYGQLGNIITTELTLRAANIKRN